MERLCQELSNLLGIPVDYYVAVDLEGFVELVDAIGGVNFEVPVDMNYDDPTQNLHIHFSKGMQYLNGEDALKVLRWRQNNEPNSGYPNGDIGRIQTQQDFLITVAKQMLSTLSLDMLNTYADLFVQYVDTEADRGQPGVAGAAAPHHRHGQRPLLHPARRGPVSDHRRLLGRQLTMCWTPRRPWSSSTTPSIPMTSR